ncbi:MAG TPA: endolytic transglycosylase MltG, partial [Pyrinomonadaceae bacterium]|nr:endolytic transglycosylase MltG [Pyrinomonadaceae bacterium]
MKLVRKLLIAVVLLLLLAGGFAFWFYRELRAPVVHERADAYIEIPRGSSPDVILSRLESAGVIRRKWPLLLYIRATGSAARLKAGDYRFPSPVSPLGVLRKLEEGEERLSRFTVIEGWTRWDIAEAMARLPELQLPDSAAALALMDDTSLVNDIDPTARNLEGYLYPDTYSFPPNTTPQKMIAAMVQRFRQVWKERYAEGALPQGRTAREVVTVASLVETEAKLPDERPLVASVIYNRLRLGIPLGVDSTVIYAAKLACKWRNDGKIY